MAVNADEHDRPLRGLVLITRFGLGSNGSCRSLYWAEPLLAKHGIKLQVLETRGSRVLLKRSLLLAIRRLLACFKLTRWRPFDFVLVNEPTPLTSCTIRGRSIVLWWLRRYLRRQHIPVFMYWHMTQWTLDALERQSPNHFQDILAFLKECGAVHLTASRASSNAVRQVLPGAECIPIYECTRVAVPMRDALRVCAPPTVVNVGSVQERKGTSLFFEVALRVCDRHPTVEFTWFGRGPELDHWRSLASDSRHARRIHFPGFVSLPEKYVESANLLFLSSRDDPFPLAALEALSLGRSVIAFDVGGAREMLGDTGSLIRPFDVDVAAEAILRRLELPVEQQVNLEGRQRYLTNYTPECFAERLVPILRARVPAGAPR